MYKCKSLQAGQLPQEHLSFWHNLLNFIIIRYLKQEVDDNPSVCVDEHSPFRSLYNWRYKDLSMSSKGNDITTPNEEVPYLFYH